MGLFEKYKTQVVPGGGLFAKYRGELTGVEVGEVKGALREVYGEAEEEKPSWLQREIVAPAKDISLKHIPEHFKPKPTPVEQIPQFTRPQAAEAVTTAVAAPTPPPDTAIRAPEAGEFERGPFKPMEMRAGEEQIDVLGREVESLKGFATFPVTASKFVFDFWRNMARSLGDSPEGKRRLKELREEGALVAEDFASGVKDWLLNAAGDQDAQLRIAERIKERGVVAESIYPLIITGVVRGGAKFTGKLSEAIKAGKALPEFLGEAHVPMAKAKVTEVVSEKPLGRETLDLTKALREKGVTEEPSPVTELPVGEPHIPPAKGKLPRADTKIRGLSQHIADRAIREKLMEKDVELPEYEIARIKAGSERAVKLTESDPAKAKSVAMGEEMPASGEGFDAGLTLVAVENAAIKAADGATLRDLALNSKLMKQATEAGQFIRTLAEREPESPVGAIRSLSKVKEKHAKRRLGDIKATRKTDMGDLRGQMKKARPSRQTIEQFIESIRC